MLLYEWRNEAGGLVSTDPTPVLPLPYGVHAFTLRVFDGKGHWDWDNVRISVQPQLSSFTLSQTKVVGGYALNANVALAGAAFAPRVDIAITTDNTSKIRTTQVRMTAGASSRNFGLKTYTVLTETVCTVTATYGGVSILRSVTLKPGGLQSLKVKPSILVGGTSTTGTILLSAPAPAGSGGRTVYLESRNPALAQVPSSVVVPEGSATVDFPITTSAVGGVTVVRVVAKLGLVVKDVDITLNP